MAITNYDSQKKRDNWLRDATRLIRFKPDRAAVRWELLSHINDRQQLHQDRGLTEAEARMKAVEDMGSADLVAKDLGRLHPPGWGYALRGAQLIVLILLVLLLFPNRVNRFYNTNLLTGFYNTDIVHQAPTPPAGGIDYLGNTIRVEKVYDLSGKARLSAHSFSVPSAWLESITYPGKNGGEDLTHYDLVLYIKGSTALFWAAPEASKRMISHNLITDSSGIRYSDRDVREKVERVFTCTAYRGGLGRVWYEVRLELGKEAPPSSLEIPIGYGSYVLHVDLEKGLVY